MVVIPPALPCLSEFGKVLRHKRPLEGPSGLASIGKVIVFIPHVTDHLPNVTQPVYGRTGIRSWIFLLAQSSSALLCSLCPWMKTVVQDIVSGSWYTVPGQPFTLYNQQRHLFILLKIHMRFPSSVLSVEPLRVRLGRVRHCSMPCIHIHSSNSYNNPARKELFLTPLDR